MTVKEIISIIREGTFVQIENINDSDGDDITPLCWDRVEKIHEAIPYRYIENQPIVEILDGIESLLFDDHETLRDGSGLVIRIAYPW